MENQELMDLLVHFIQALPRWRERRPRFWMTKEKWPLTMGDTADRLCDPKAAAIGIQEGDYFVGYCLQPRGESRFAILELTGGGSTSLSLVEYRNGRWDYSGYRPANGYA